MISLGDLILAAVLLGPKPPWWRPIRRMKWLKGAALIKEAAAMYTMQKQAELRRTASLGKAQWGQARVEDGEVN